MAARLSRVPVLAMAVLAGTAGAAQAQVGMRGPTLGPTSHFAVPRAYILPAGQNLVSGTLYLGESGTVFPTNGLQVGAEMGIGPGMQLDMGLHAAPMVPWQGGLSLAAKGNMIGTRGMMPAISWLAGGLLAVNANGQPALGLQLGLPMSLALPFNDVNYLGFSLNPALNMTVGRPWALLPGGAWPNAQSFVSLGMGADFRVLPNLLLMADTNIGIPGLTGVSTTSNLGARIGFGRAFALDLFVGSGTSSGLGSIPASFGVTGHWGY